MFGKQKPRASSELEGESPWISFTDLMAGFLVVILLALSAAIIMLTLEKSELRKEREEVSQELIKAKQAEEQARLELEEARRKQELAKQEQQRMLHISKQLIKSIDEVKATQTRIAATIKSMSDYDETRKTALEAIQQRLKDNNIKVEISDSGDVIHISEENLSFALGSYNIQRKYRRAVNYIGSEVAQQLEESKLGSIVDTVFVEGHTDNVRNSKEMGNWGLSSYRAISLWQHWENSSARSNKLHTLKNAHGDALFSVTGYGETRPRIPFASGSSKDQAANRRIDIRFNLQAVKSDLLEKLYEDVNSSRENIEAIQRTVQQQVSQDHE